MKDQVVYVGLTAVGTVMEYGSKARRWARRHDRAITNVLVLGLAVSARRNGR